MDPVFLIVLSCVMAACSDPPDPPATPAPADLPRYATAPHVQWAGLSRTTAPLAVFVDQPGGPLDRLAHDADVATFLNDRFTPLFLTPAVAPDLPEAILFVDERGCLLLDPVRPQTPADFIEAANTVMLGSAPRKWPAQPSSWGVALPEAHPLWLRCPLEP